MFWGLSVEHPEYGIAYIRRVRNAGRQEFTEGERPRGERKERNKGGRKGGEWEGV